MAASALARQQLELDILPPLRTRDEIIHRYRHVREVSRRINNGLLELVSGNAIIKQAQKLGLTLGRTVLLDSEDQMAFLFDLAIYTAPPDRTRAIDRYAKTARLESGSDEARVFEAMRNARFVLGTVERRHKMAGLIIGDALRQTDFWLMDEGLESSVENGTILATRVFTPDEFSVTCGVMMPIDLAIVKEVIAEVWPRLKNRTLEEVCNDRRFAEAIYRTAMAYGVMDEIGFRYPTSDD
ncbi:MAG: hypothetical protein JO084_08815 [Bradyrhizobiaceae bacterium]|nr:hypothetical protein [Bradyrhizobiaceae bacterium]